MGVRPSVSATLACAGPTQAVTAASAPAAEPPEPPGSAALPPVGRVPLRREVPELRRSRPPIPPPGGADPGAVDELAAAAARARARANYEIM